MAERHFAHAQVQSVMASHASELSHASGSKDEHPYQPFDVGQQKGVVSSNSQADPVIFWKRWRW